MGDIPANYITAWYASWRLDKVLDGPCPDCKNDLSLAFKLLSNNYPNDRLSLLESTQDQTIRSYFLLSATGFEQALRRMVAEVLDPTPNFRYFIETGSFHTVLGSPATHTSQGVNLNDWMKQLVTDDANWKSVLPP